MISFPSKYHEAIKEAKINVTFRPWTTLTLQKNKIYKSSNLGLIKVLDVSFVKLPDLRIDDIKRCGFKNLQEFKREYESSVRREVDYGAESAVRIEFEYLGSDIENRRRAMGKVKPLELIDIKEKILSMEAKAHSSWISKSLHLLHNKGHLSSKALETLLQIPSDKIKQNMRKLKELDLIYSHTQKGYSLTPLSMKLIKILYKK